ncbi:hypothetical protein E4U53_006914 [Claviceps sorghi]|nr:hypothetical protein E4U53_006914 [Claviceps sorghi]
MSSTHLSCGRKRSLLRTFGSRRRRKDFAVASSVQPEVLQAVSGTSTKPNHGITEPHNSQCSRIHAKLPMATTPMRVNNDFNTRAQKTPLPEGDLEAGTPCKRSTDRPRDAYRFPVSPFRMHPVMMTRTSQLTRDAETSIARRSSMAESRSSEAAHATRRYTTNSMQLGGTVDKLRLVDSSAYSSEENLALAETSNVAVSVPPTGGQGKLLGQTMSSTKVLSKHGLSATTEDIHHKVAQMVAATDALKPTTPTRRATDSRASAQAPQSRGFAKLLGRFCSKSASPESKVFKKRSKLGNCEKDALLTRSASQPDWARPALSAIEIRLNEDQNLHRDKVQQMMGVQSICRPVNPTWTRGHSYDGQLGTEATPEEEQQRGPTEPTGAHHLGSRHESWSSANPFDSEEDFECNLDQGILHASPAGSSTPRIRIHRSSDPGSNDYSIQDLSGESMGQVNVAKIIQIGKRTRMTEPTSRQVTFQTAALDSRRSSRGECLHPNEDTANAKKHPSPSKRDLEELERAFRQYEPPAARYQDGDDADELAAASPTVLFARERS